MIKRKCVLIERDQPPEKCCRKCEKLAQCFAERGDHGVQSIPFYHFGSMGSLQLTLGDVFLLLQLLAVLLGIIVLYQLVFATMALRRIMKRYDALSQDIEALLIKPVSAIDSIIDWFLAVMDGMQSSKKEEEKKLK